MPSIALIKNHLSNRLIEHQLNIVNDLFKIVIVYFGYSNQLKEWLDAPQNLKGVRSNLKDLYLANALFPKFTDLATTFFLALAI